MPLSKETKPNQTIHLLTIIYFQVTNNNSS